MTRVSIDVRDGGAAVSTLDYLGDRWSVFQATLAAFGARWNKLRGRDSLNIAPLENLPALVAGLTKAGMTPVLSQAAKEALEAAARSGYTSAEEIALKHCREMEAEAASHGLSLRPYQRDGVVFLASRDRALLGDQPGLGKTIQALLAMPVGAPVLIICPASIIVNWAREARRWRPTHKVTIILRTTRRVEDELDSDGIYVEKTMRWPAAGEIVVVNYESSRWANSDGSSPAGSKTVFGKPLAGTVLVGDEIHRCKNRSAAVTKRWQSIAQAIKDAGGKVWGMSGTPIYNRPFDLATVLRSLFVFGDVFVSWKDFLRRMGAYQDGYGWSFTGKIDPTVPDSMKRVMLRREKKDVLKELPEKTYRTVDVAGTDALNKLCDEILEGLKKRGVDVDELFREARSGEEEKAGEYDADEEGRVARVQQAIPFEQMSRLHAMCSEIGFAGAVGLIEDLEEEDEPVIVFSPHRGPVEQLGKRPGWATIMGGEPPESRAEIVARFQRGELKGVAGTIGAMREGITLTRSANEIFLGLSWSPSDNLQASDRAHRIGQTRGLQVNIMVVAHPLVRRIVELLRWKEEMHQAAIGDATVVDSMAAERRAAAEQALKASVVAEPVPCVEENFLDGDGVEHAKPIVPLSSLFLKPLPPSTPLGRWICESLVALDGANSDGAVIKNDVGYNRLDTDFGRSLAKCVREKGGLTVKQYRAALRMLRKYSRQVGTAPVSEDEAVAAMEDVE